MKNTEPKPDKHGIICPFLDKCVKYDKECTMLASRETWCISCENNTGLGDYYVPRNVARFPSTFELPFGIPGSDRMVLPGMSGPPPEFDMGFMGPPGMGPMGPPGMDPSGKDHFKPRRG